MENILSIDHTSDIPKYRQVINGINAAIAQNKLHFGDALPSVNKLCNKENLSRDTVVKSYNFLKNQGVIDSVPNKGYYVAKETRRIFLLLDTFKAYKEVLYHNFINNLPENYIVDVQFHHYNPEIFKKLVNDSLGNYSGYVIMPFNNNETKRVLTKIPKNNLLVIDWDVFNDTTSNVICQDFGSAFFQSMEQALPELLKYKSVHLVYPNYTNHPKIIVTSFKNFCKKYQIKFTVKKGCNDFQVEKNTAFICVSERSLGYLLTQCKSNDFEIGKDVGIISYNETPMKQFIGKGISVISTDFELMGKKAAEFILNNEIAKLTIPTTFIKRSSI